MLDRKITELADTMIRNQFEERNEKLRRDIERVHSKMSAQGLGRSGAVIEAVYDLCAREVELRAQIVWKNLVMVLSNAGVLPSEGLAHDLRERVREYLPSIYSEPFECLQKVVRLIGVGVAKPLTDIRDRALSKVNAQIELFILRAAVRPAVEMTPEEELQKLDERLTLLGTRFSKSSEGLVLPADEQADFKQIILEATSLFDGVLGAGNPFSIGVNRTVTEGSGGFFGGPSYLCLREVQGVLRAGLRELERRRATVPHASSAKKPDRYVSDQRIQELRAFDPRDCDLTRLIRLCEEVNAAYDDDSYMTIGMLVRAIVDHVPPIFNLKTFTEVGNNYKGSKSFKSAMQHLDVSLRNAADSFLHVQIRSREILPNFQQVDFRADLDVLLAEVVRVLK